MINYTYLIKPEISRKMCYDWQKISINLTKIGNQTALGIGYILANRRPTSIYQAKQLSNVRAIEPTTKWGFPITVYKIKIYNILHDTTFKMQLVTQYDTDT